MLIVDEEEWRGQRGDAGASNPVTSGKKIKLAEPLVGQSRPLLLSFY